MLNRRTMLAVSLLAIAPGLALAQAPTVGDPLPSWNDSPVRHSIIDFVTRVTTDGSPDFVPPAERIATFDNDGTLWTEQPIYFQLAFAFDRIKALAPKHPEWKTKQPFKALLDRDMRGVGAAGEKGLLEIMAASHTGVSTEEFSKAVLDWTANARHPRFNRPYTELVYQPMLELLAYLRANGFKTFVVSGGGIEFMRPWMEKVYGIPPEQVVGSSGVVKFQADGNGRPELMKLAKVEFIDDGPENRSASTVSSAGDRSLPSATPTAICRCCSGRWRAQAPASRAWCTTRTLSASTPTTAVRKSASSTRRSMRRPRSAGPSSI